MYKFFKLLTSLLLLTGIYSCTNSAVTPKGITQERAIDQKLESQVIPIASMFLYIPSRIIMLDSGFLLIYDNVQENFFNIISLRDQKLINSWGEMGNGPEEFQMINDQSIQYQNNVLSFLNINELYKYKFSPSYDSVIYSGNELLRSSTDPINNLVQISDSIFLARSNGTLPN